jgi:phosphoglycolate phosphatase-like HAD superfamily hydrolase
VRAAAVDLDAVLGDTRPLWRDWVTDAARRFRVELDLSDDRTQAAAQLDERIGNWRALLQRFAEERAPVYLRPQPDTNAVLRRLHSAGTRIGVFSDAPLELVRVALAHLGAARRVDVAGTLEEVRAALGDDAVLVRSREQLASLN